MSCIKHLLVFNETDEIWKIITCSFWLRWGSKVIWFVFQVTFEGSPQYIRKPEAPERIWKMNPDMKLVVTLTDPVRRVISAVTHILTNADNPNATRETTVQAYLGEDWEERQEVHISVYFDYVVKYLKYFPLSQIHFVDGQKLITAPWVEMMSLERFLGVPAVSNETQFIKSSKGYYCRRKQDDKRKCLGDGKGRKHVPISEKFYKTLEKYYKPHNQKLYDLLGRKFEWS